MCKERVLNKTCKMLRCYGGETNISTDIIKCTRRDTFKAKMTLYCITMTVWEGRKVIFQVLQACKVKRFFITYKKPVSQFWNEVIFNSLLQADTWSYKLIMEWTAYLFKAETSAGSFLLRVITHLKEPLQHLAKRENPEIVSSCLFLPLLLQQQLLLLSLSRQTS